MNKKAAHAGVRRGRRSEAAIRAPALWPNALEPVTGFEDNYEASVPPFALTTQGFRPVKERPCRPSLVDTVRGVREANSTAGWFHSWTTDPWSSTHFEMNS